MRGVSVGLFAIFSTVPVSSAFAANCYWYTGYWYCDAGCSISRRWWDADGREWINYSCTPSLDDPAFIIGVIVIVLGIVALCSSNSETSMDDTTEIDADTAVSNALKAELEAAARAADEHIAKLLAKVRNNGDRNDKP